MAVLVAAKHVGYDTKGERINIISMLVWRLFDSIFIRILLLELVAVFLRNDVLKGFINESRLKEKNLKLSSVTCIKCAISAVIECHDWVWAN